MNLFLVWRWRNFPPMLEHECSSQCSQEKTLDTLDTHESIHILMLYLFQIHFNIIPSSQLSYPHTHRARPHITTETWLDIQLPILEANVQYVRVSWLGQSVQCLATGWTTGRLSFDSRQRRKNFSSSLSVSRPTLVLTQPPVQWVPGVFSLGLKRGRGVTLTTHHHILQKSRMSRSYIPSPPSASVACRRTALAFQYVR
jgi:hypothetical protein